MSSVQNTHLNENSIMTGSDELNNIELMNDYQSGKKRSAAGMRLEPIQHVDYNNQGPITVTNLEMNEMAHTE